MITKNTIKYIHSLSQKKYRDAARCFVVEGPKAVTDLLPYLSCRCLYATEEFQTRIASRLPSFRVKEVVCITQQELERLSQLRTPRDCVALFEMPVSDESWQDWATVAQSELCLALDGVQDPGNLGTILRIADWFGIRHVFASPDTADVYAPKVVQATMGAIGTVRVHYGSLPVLLQPLKGRLPIYGTFLDGEDLYTQQLSSSCGVIVMGNEGKGITSEVGACVTHRLLIPSFAAEGCASESLNVAVATAIVCAELRRQGRS